MAATFVGMTITVVLRAPSHATLTGRVVDIRGQTLALENVFFHESGRSMSSWSIPSSEIADLSVVEANMSPQKAPSATTNATRPELPSFGYHSDPRTNAYLTNSPYETLMPVRSLNTAAISDPAILSYHRPGSITITGQTPIAEVAASSVEVGPVEIGDGSVQDQSNPIVVPQQTPMQKPRRGKGWRSTPLLEETSQPTQTPETPSRTAQKGKKNSKAKKSALRSQQAQAMQNGWATEDATDIQDMGDFDFEANHAKFDKKSVFDQIRNEDTTADEDRLVSHNRLARPGTYGGKNLHPTEMVLSPPLKQQSDNQDSLSDADTELNLASGRNSRQSTRSRTSSRHMPRRSVSGVHDERSLSRALKAVPSGINPLSASIMSASSHRSNSSLRNAAIRAGSVASPLRGTFQQQQPHFRTRATQQFCPTLLPARLRQLEEEALQLSIGPESVIELSARGIAQCMTLSAARMPMPARRNSKESMSARPSISSGPKPVIVILAGNHAKGARALAAARQLYGRGYKMLIAVTNFDKPKTWTSNIAKQIRVLQNIGRKAARIEGWPSTSAQIKRLNSPPALILDALLDGSRYGDIQDAQHAIEVREMVDWMNRSRAAVISVTCPSGYDAETGETTVMDGEPLAVKPDRILALGGPVQGLLEAVQDGEGWAINVLDIGIAPAMKREETVPFGTEWSIEIEFLSGIAEIDTR